jgi:hypothetical protein
MPRSRLVRNVCVQQPRNSPARVHWLASSAARHNACVSPKSKRSLALIIALYIGGTLVARRLGYKLGGNVVVRCRQGHLFTTIWIPGASLKAIRLGWARLQRCPVGNHWTLVTPVRDSDLTDEERRTAEQHRDIRIP